MHIVKYNIPVGNKHQGQSQCKDRLSLYGDSNFKDKTVVRLSYLFIFTMEIFIFVMSGRWIFNIPDVFKKRNRSLSWFTAIMKRLTCVLK